MTTSKEFLTVPLTRNMAACLVGSEIRDITRVQRRRFQARRVSGSSDPQKTGNKESEVQLTLGLPQLRRSLETPVKNARGPNFRREIGWRSPLLERLGEGQENAGATKTPNKEKNAVGSPGKRRLDDDVKVLPSRHSEWLNRISSFNERVSGVKTADTVRNREHSLQDKAKLLTLGRTRGAVRSERRNCEDKPTFRRKRF
ncbi:hypothetical protein OS493_036314 [Desmophyllum pertusum]|uniref:Uncharacterized protein n=1 Tax=Desmophyllum pertusum TaxID=174260 RepID=A0A9X0CUM4_9CNID|nr:hypothetical protein OS493_036314 [Desmophyllum pertusum]